MQLALVIAVALFVVGVAAWPLIAGRRRTSETIPPDGAAAGHGGNRTAELESVYDAIRTLQTEHSLGRISDADFRAQLAEYRRQAAQILRALEQPTSTPQEQNNGNQP